MVARTDSYRLRVRVFNSLSGNGLFFDQTEAQPSADVTAIGPP